MFMLRKGLRKKGCRKGDTITVFTSWPLCSPKNGAPHKTNINTNKHPSQAVIVALQHYLFLAPQQSENAMIIKHLLIPFRKLHCAASLFMWRFSRSATRSVAARTM
jgi:hypothetical protein